MAQKFMMIGKWYLVYELASATAIFTFGLLGLNFPRLI
jgi:hypothetical protein